MECGIVGWWNFDSWRAPSQWLNTERQMRVHRKQKHWRDWPSGSSHKKKSQKSGSIGRSLIFFVFVILDLEHQKSPPNEAANNGPRIMENGWQLGANGQRWIEKAQNCHNKTKSGQEEIDDAHSFKYVFVAHLVVDTSGGQNSPACSMSQLT